MKRYLAILLAVVFALAMIGCSNMQPLASEKSSAYDSAYGGSYNDYASPQAAPAPDVRYEAEYYDGASANWTSLAAGAMKNESVGNDDVFDRYGGHKVIRTFYVELQSNNFDEHIAAIFSSLYANGGYAETSNINGRKPEVYGDRGRTAYLVLRVPSKNADAFMGSVQQIGLLLSSSESAADVTAQYFDIETRLEVLRTQLERLKAIMVTTDNLADIIQLEIEIARVTYEIESLTSEKRRYDGLIDYSTFTVNVQEESLKAGPAAQKDPGERMSEDFTNTLYGVGNFFVDFAVWFVGALPVLVLLGGIAVGVIFIIRGAKKRKAKKAKAAANTYYEDDGNGQKNAQ